ncbi:MAG: MFS transporter [Desulfohalobiaceae bacterium]|nr:MFS transporter [Desulfohalobiaceae bacterium]
MQTLFRAITSLLFLFVLGHFFHHLLTALPVPLLPMIRNEFGLNYTQAGLAVSAFTLAYGLGQLPAGWLSDRIGPRVLLTIGLSGVALAGFLVGISKGHLMLTIFLALMGFLGGGYHPAAPPLILSVVEKEKRGQALGLHMTGGSASYFIAPIIAAAIASVWGWRGAFLGLAVPTALFGFVFSVLLGRRGAKNPLENLKKPPGIEGKAPDGQIAHLVFFLIMSVFLGAVFISVVSFIPLFLVDEHRINEETAGALIGLIYSAGLWVGPLAGYLSDRLGRVPMIVTVSFAAGPIVFLLNLVPYGWGFFALLIVMGIIMYVRMPVSESYILGQTSSRHRSSILGIYYFGTMEGGGVLTPLMGFMIDRLGFSLCFLITGATLMMVTLVCTFWIWGSRDH